MKNILQLYEDRTESILKIRLQDELNSCIKLINLIVKHSCHNPKTDVECVDTIMLMRMVRDLRCILMMVSRGYATQSASLAAGLTEQLGALAIVSGNEENAQEWKHQSRRKNNKKIKWHFPSKANMGGNNRNENVELYKNAFIKGLVVTTWDPKDAVEFVNRRIVNAYSVLCKAKHADPKREILDHICQVDKSLVIGSIPLQDDLQTSSLRMTIAVSTFLVSQAYWIYMWHHSEAEVIHLRHREYKTCEAVVVFQMDRAYKDFTDSCKRGDEGISSK